MSEEQSKLQEMSLSELVGVLVAFSCFVAVLSLGFASQPPSVFSPYSQVAIAIAGGALAVALGLSAIALALLNIAQSRGKTDT
jgi:hypothetical protein